MVILSRNKKIIGIIGGGQLGMMITEASKNLSRYISDIIVVDPTPQCPASKMGAKQIIGDYSDENAITKLAEESDIITYEIESGNVRILKKLEKLVEINPSPKSLEIIQDKLKQKKFLFKNKLPVPIFDKIQTVSDFIEKSNKFDLPLMMKARKGGYDGHGNILINSLSDIHNYHTKLHNGFFIEKIIDFKMEISVIIVRNAAGDISMYPISENIHSENILRMAIVPARIKANIEKKAKEIAKNAIKCFNGAGVFCVEMFLTQDDNILINEIAPRVHNSGHHTLQSSATSQFEQHLRAILGLKLGSTKLLHSTITYNILGPKNFHGRFKPISVNKSNVFIKMYHKPISKPLRKLGHVNIISNDNNIDTMLKTLHDIKKSITVTPI